MSRIPPFLKWAYLSVSSRNLTQELLISSRDSMRAIAWAIEPSKALELDHGLGASLLPARKDRYLFSPEKMRYTLISNKIVDYIIGGVQCQQGKGNNLSRTSKLSPTIHYNKNICVPAVNEFEKMSDLEDDGEMASNHFSVWDIESLMLTVFIWFSWSSLDSSKRKKIWIEVTFLDQWK